MKVEQIYALANQGVTQATGQSDLLKNDLTNLVDVGKAIMSSNTSSQAFKDALVDAIAKRIVVNRIYKGSLPTLYRDKIEYGAVIQKIRFKMPDAVKDDAWYPEDGQSYDQDIYHESKGKVKYFSSKKVFQLKLSVLDDQLKPAFNTPEQMGAFIDGLFTAISNKLNLENDGLMMMTLTNIIGEVLATEYPDADYTTKSTIKAVNLLKEYNDKFKPAEPLTTDTAPLNEDFIRYMAFRIKDKMSLLTKPSKLHNVGGEIVFTPKDMQHLVMLDYYKNAAEIYLYDGKGQFNSDNIKLENVETVPYWQGSGLDDTLANRSKINIQTVQTNKTVELSGVVAVLFDHDALGIMNDTLKVTSHYNAAASFTNYFYHQEAMYFNDLDENVVVFFIA